jgi:hypothetical protein
MIGDNIRKLGEKEIALRKLMVDAQTDYLKHKKSHSEYDQRVARLEKEIGEVRQRRSQLRHRRINIISSENIERSLDFETAEITKSIEELQEKFYKDKKVSNREYDSFFKHYQERLAEIEEERTTFRLKKK